MLDWDEIRNKQNNTQSSTQNNGLDWDKIRGRNQENTFKEVINTIKNNSTPIVKTPVVQGPQISPTQFYKPLQSMPVISNETYKDPRLSVYNLSQINKTKSNSKTITTGNKKIDNALFDFGMDLLSNKTKSLKSKDKKSNMNIVLDTAKDNAYKKVQKFTAGVGIGGVTEFAKPVKVFVENYKEDSDARKKTLDNMGITNPVKRALYNIGDTAVDLGADTVNVGLNAINNIAGRNYRLNGGGIVNQDQYRNRTEQEVAQEVNKSQDEAIKMYGGINDKGEVTKWKQAGQLYANIMQLLGAKTVMTNPTAIFATTGTIQGYGNEGTTEGAVVGGTKGAITGKIFKTLSPVTQTLSNKVLSSMNLDTSVVANYISNIIGAGGKFGASNMFSQVGDILKLNPNGQYIDYNEIQDKVNNGEIKTEEDLQKAISWQIVINRASEVGMNVVQGMLMETLLGGKTAKANAQQNKINKSLNKMSMQDVYKTLGINENTTFDEAKAQYRKLAKINHPDITKDNGEIMQKINVAYDNLLQSKGWITPISNNNASINVENNSNIVPINNQQVNNGIVTGLSAINNVNGSRLQTISQQPQIVQKTTDINAPRIDFSNDSNISTIPENEANIQNQGLVDTSSFSMQNNGVNGQYSVNKYSFVDDPVAKNIPTESKQIIQDFINKRDGLSAKWDNSLNSDGLIIKNKNGTREIRLNPKSSKAYEFVVTHELLHDFEGNDNELKEFVINRAISHGDYEEAKAELIKKYEDFYIKNNLDMSNLDIEEEAIGDMVAQAIGNQDFINELADKKPNIFIRIYNWIKNVLFGKKHTGNTFSERNANNKYLQELKTKFEKAYNGAYQGNNSTNYSIAGQKGMKNAIDNDIRFKRLENNLKKAQTMAQNGIDNETIRQQTNWFQDKNGDWKFEFPDKYMKLKSNIDLTKKQTLKLGDILEHDLLFEIYPELYNYTVKIEDIGEGINGSINKNNIITLNPSAPHKAKTIIHELQHAIQKIEGFERGTSSKLSKLSYYSNLGEIEANDVAERYENNTNLYNVPIESSKNNPKHSKLDNYLKKRGTIDKIKDGIFKNLNKGEKSYEIYEKDSKQDSKQNINLVVERKNIKELEKSSSFSIPEKSVEVKLKELNEDFKLISKVRDQSYDLRDGAKTEAEIQMHQADIDACSKRLEELAIMIDRLEKSNRNIDDAITQAKKEFGTTSDFREAGYLLQDGTLLDFSGRNQGSNARGRRTLDHRDINQVGYDMDEFINAGNIRLQPEVNNFELMQEPTEKQYEMLKKYIDRASGTIYVDIWKDGKMHNCDGAVFKSGTSTNKIMSDLQYYFKNGKFPTKSEFSEFRYSLSKETDTAPAPKGKWQDYLDKNWDLMPNANKTNPSLPTKEQLQEFENKKTKKIEKDAEVLSLGTYKNKMFKNNANAINNTIQTKNNQINLIDEQINKARQELSNKKDKGTKIATTLANRIIRLEKQKADIETKYVSVIDRLENKNSKLNQLKEQVSNDYIPTREEVQSDIIDKTKLDELNLSDINKMSKLSMNNNTPIRLVEKLFKDKKTVESINENFFYKVKHNESERTRFLNKERAEIKDLGIKPGTKESSAVQKYGEGEVVDVNTGESTKYTLNDLKNEFPESWEKIKNASEVIRGKYDTYIDTINEVLNENGYDAIPKRKDYFRHFEEITDLFSKVGIPSKADNLPTDINGLTADRKPGKNFFSSALSRTGNKTSYNAIKGIDDYLDGASKLIYHTGDIQRLRTLEKFVRDTFGATNGTENFNDMSEDEKSLRISQIQEGHLSDFASWLREYTNNLSGKKAMGDRGVEDWFGRQAYSTLNLMKKQVGSNLTGFNVNSALSNFISATQGLAKTNKIPFIKGTVDTIKNIFKNDGFVDKSDFLTTRFGSDKLSKTLWEKASNTGQIFMNGTDYFTANQIVRGKYYEYLQKGYNESEAIKKADKFADKLMAGRGLGDMPNIYNSKILGLVTQFQLEANNQMDSIFYDTFKEDYAKDSKSKFAKDNPKMYNSAVATFILGQLFVYAWLFNNEKEKLTGTKGALDPIGTIQDAIKYYTSEDLTTSQANKKIFEDISNQLPYASLLTGGGRIPTAESIPNLYKIATGESKIKDEAEKLPNLLFPTGGGQIKKTAKAIKTLSEGGDYNKTASGEKLRFSTGFDTMTDKEKFVRTAQALTFGKYSLPNARDYIESGFKSLSESQTEKYKKLQKMKVTSEDARDLIEAMSKVEGKKDKKGKTISGSVKEAKINTINKALPKLTDKEKEKVYGIFNISVK